MSKAVLVLDEMPDNCFKCRFCQFAFDSDLFEEGEAYCAYESESIQENLDNGSKPDWCPLSELPKRKDLTKTKSETEFATFTGWNLCMTAITGKMEE